MTTTEMVALVQKQLEAYNARDLEKFCSCYHPEVQVFRDVTQGPSTKGMDAFRETYRERFSQNPNLHAEIKNRIVLESSVIDEEFVSGMSGNSESICVAAIYQFKDDLIYRIWFVR